MKAFAQFMRDGAPVLGSDGIYILDARKTIDSMICDIEKHIEIMKGMRSFKHFQIRKGDLTRSKVVYETHTPASIMLYGYGGR